MKHRVLILFTAAAGFIAVASSLAQDFVTIRRVSDCCFSLTALNRNSSGTAINELAIKCSPSVRILANGIAPTGWTLSYMAPQSAVFTAGMSQIQPGGLLSGFQLCFLSQDNNFWISWITMGNGQPLTYGTADLSCRDTDTLHVVRDFSNEGCCHQAAIRNRNNDLKPINALTLELLTPGYLMSDVARPATWNAALLGAGHYRFETATSPVSPGANLPGFSFCLLPSTGLSDSVQIEWITWDGNTILTRDTITLQCETPRRCDVLLATADSTDPCCYDVALLNNHAPESRLDELHLRMLTPGARFSSVGSSVWPVISSDAGEVKFGSAEVLLDSRAIMGGMRICIENAPSKTDPVRMLWQTWRSNRPICSDTLLLECAPPVVPACDSIFHSLVRDCDLRFGFRNTHVPSGQLNGFRVRTITPGALLENPAPPAAWTVLSAAPTAVTWRSNSPVNPNTLIVGFGLSLQPASSGSPALLELCTLFNGSPVCCDTVAISCTPQSRCDSLLIEESGGDCAWSLGFVNIHRPSSAVEGFRVSLNTPGASIRTASAPSGWIIPEQTPTSVRYADTSGGVPVSGTQRGFEIAFTPAVSVPLIEFEWCSTGGSEDICCGIGYVQCVPPQPRCDSLIVRPTAEACTFDAGFANLHTPASAINGFSVDLATAGAVISSAAAPSGWITEDADFRRVVFRDTSGGTAHGNVRSGFLLSLLPSISGSSIRLAWRTWLDSTVLCVDTVIVECETVERTTDSVFVIPDPQRPCCAEFRLRNSHIPASIINRFDVSILTADVLLFQSQVRSPAGWVQSGSETRASFRTVSAGVSYGASLEGCILCFDNSATGHDPFDVSWEAYSGLAVTSSDTIRLECDRTLFVERAAGPLPAEFSLRQNYPNPLTERTRLTFDVASDGEIRLALLDASGRTVRVLTEGRYRAGVYHMDVDASSLPRGIYFYCLEYDGKRITRAMTVLR